jgi:hypothetical protein
LHLSNKDSEYEHAEASPGNKRKRADESASTISVVAKPLNSEGRDEPLNMDIMG